MTKGVGIRAPEVQLSGCHPRVMPTRGWPSVSQRQTGPDTQPDLGGQEVPCREGDDVVEKGADALVLTGGPSESRRQWGQL